MNSTVKFTVKETAQRNGIANPFALARATGLYYDTCQSLWKDQAQRIDKRTLARVCETLNCTTGELISYVPAKPKPKTKSSANGKKTVRKK